EIFRLEPGGADDRALLVDVGDDLLDVRLAVTERLARLRDRLVDDRHLAAADQLLVLDQREVRLDPGRVAVHQERDRAGRRPHRRLRVAGAVALADPARLVPGVPGRGQQAPVPAILTRDRV